MSYYKNYSRVLVVGDLHNCYDEFRELLDQADFSPDKDMIVAVGDLVDRGPKASSILNWFMGGKKAGFAESVLGNHDEKYLRYLQGNKVQLGGGLAKTIGQVDNYAYNTGGLFYKLAVYYFLKSLPLHFRHRDFMVVHGAYRTICESDSHEKNLALRGEPISDTQDENGNPIRSEQWKYDWNGQFDIICGHTVVEPCPAIVKSASGKEVICIDGGCAYGGELVAIEYPSKKIYRVKAKKVYHERASKSE